MINTTVKQFIFDRLMVTSVDGVFTKDIAMGMRNCRTLIGDSSRAIVISDYDGVSYLLGIRLAVNTLAMTVELLDSDRDYFVMLEKYMVMA